jgi:hypothetical protein
MTRTHTSRGRISSEPVPAGPTRAAVVQWPPPWMFAGGADIPTESPVDHESGAATVFHDADFDVSVESLCQWADGTNYLQQAAIRRHRQQILDGERHNANRLGAAWYDIPSTLRGNL